MGKIDGWPDELARLDRHYGSTLPTPDIASLAELMRTYKVPGVSIAAGDLDGELWCAGFGSTGLISESTRFRYSGSHYQVLQQLLTDVTNTPFDELMRTLVLEPVGMPDSSYRQDFPHRRPGQVAFAHDTPGSPVAGGWQKMPEMAGAGLWTTPGDLVRLDLEIARAASGESALLNRHSAREMLTPQVPGGMGLGTQLETAHGRQWFGHGGSNIGYRCYTMAWPELGTAIAAMANSGNGTELIMSVMGAAQRYFATAAPEPDDSLTPDQVTGRYLLRDDFPIEVVADPATLSVLVPGQPAVELTPLPGGRYRFPGLDSQVWFERENDAIVLRLHQEGETQSAARQRG